VRRAGRPRLYLHIGEPKTGTTFVQDALWSNRDRLAGQGVLLPGYSVEDHSRASRDLRKAPRAASDPAAQWAGDFEVLVAEALLAPEAAVISNELFVACTPAQADRAVRSMLSADLHVVITVRDIAKVLTAEWQEAIKTRGTVTWENWLDAVIGTAPLPDRRQQSWFWAVHSTLTNLGMWSEHIPPDNVHVITVPQQGPADLLWTRFASVLGIDGDRLALPAQPVNTSLGVAEAEFLRQLNGVLSADIPDWFYTRRIKRILAHRMLGSRTGQARLVLPPAADTWAQEQSELLVAGLKDSKYHIVGDLTELLSQPVTGSYIGPADVPSEQLLDIAVLAGAALLEYHYQDRFPAKKPQEGPRGARTAISQLKWTVLNGPATRSRLRKASRHKSARRLRVAIWRVLMHPARHRRTATNGGRIPLSPLPGLDAAARDLDGDSGSEIVS
jgi:hypothetical protein